MRLIVSVFLGFGVFLLPFFGFSQFTLTEALDKARIYSPYARVKELSSIEKDLKLENIRKQYLFQVALSAQGTQ